MGKIFFFIIAAMIGGLYYVKENKLFDLDKLSGVKKVETKPAVPLNPDGTPVRQPIFQAGDCLNVAKEGWNYYKILSSSEEHYTYKVCVKFKGCSPEAEKKQFVEFEKEYDLTKKLPSCP